MTVARDAVLERIRAALGRKPGQTPPALPHPRLDLRNLTTPERVELFVQQFAKLNGKPVRVRGRAQAAAVIRDLLNGRTAVASNAPFLNECGITGLAGVSSGFQNADELRAACASSDIGITSADYALADTGSLVMISSQKEARLVSLLPPIHVAVIPAGNILTGLDQLLTEVPMPAEQTSAMVLITGPSRTADIEQILVRGVHGPGEIHAVIVEEGEQ